MSNHMKSQRRKKRFAISTKVGNLEVADEAPDADADDCNVEVEGNKGTPIKSAEPRRQFGVIANERARAGNELKKIQAAIQKAVDKNDFASAATLQAGVEDLEAAVRLLNLCSHACTDGNQPFVLGHVCAGFFLLLFSLAVCGYVPSPLSYPLSLS